MKRQFIIFLSFASLAQSSYVIPTLSVSYGLSEKELAVFNEIIVNQEAKIIAYIDGFTALFDILSNLATKLIFNREPETPHQSFDLDKPFMRLKDAVDLSLDSVVLALGKSCSVVEVARDAAHDYLDDALAQVTGALEPAHRGNYSENRETIEVYQDAVQKDFTNLLESVYDTIYTCLGTTDDETPAVIEDFRNKSCVSLVRVNNAFFNAMKLYAVAVTFGYGDMSLVSEIEDCRGKARLGLMTDVENEFGLHKTLYINSRLNQAGILRELAVNQHAVTASYHKYKDAIEILFQTVRGYLKRPAFGLYADGENDFPRTDIALNEIIIKQGFGDRYNLDSILAMYPNSRSAIADVWTKLNDMNYVLNVHVFDVIVAAAAVKSINYSETLELIQECRETMLSSSLERTEHFFNLIRNNRTWADEIEAEITILENFAASSVTNATNQFFDGVVTLANAILEGVVTEQDFSGIQNGLDISVTGCNNFTQALSAAGVLVLKANNVS